MPEDPRDHSGSRSSFVPFARGRRHPARPAPIESGNRAVILFVTVCTATRKAILDNEESVEAILNAWQAAEKWCVGRYIILPDHHLFCAPARHDALPVQKWIAFWKSLASRNWPRPNEHSIWQTDCWDTQLRRGESYDAKWDYVHQNSVRHGLVGSAEDWPDQGELNILDWRD